MKEKIVIALGGNALLRSDEKGSSEEQLFHVHETCLHFVELLNEGYFLIITHGNGPQVGSILLQNETAQDRIPPMPLDICGAESQGMIGYMIQRLLKNALSIAEKDMEVVTILTQTEVSKNDPAFKNPTKPIGLFYKEDEAKRLAATKGWKMIEQVGKGFRRVVPSPEPINIVEGEVIKRLIASNTLVIACGGGGIPVVRDPNGVYTGVEAVIDKDHTASVLARVVGADTLMILTDVEQVAINFAKPNQKFLNKLTITEAKKYLAAGEFAKGSMGPKVEAACNFLEKGGKKSIITSLEKAKEALRGQTGTHFLH
jgi:carbamate kinase